MLCIPNNLIKDQSFVCIQLNGQTVLFLTIWFNISHLFAHSLNYQTVLFYPIIGFYQVLPQWARVDLGAMTIHIPQSCRAVASPSNGLVSYPGHLLGGGGLAPLQRCNQHILQPQLMGLRSLIGLESYPFAKMQSAYFMIPVDGPQVTHWDWVLPLCKDTIGIFYNCSWLGHGTLIGMGSYSFTKMQSAYFTTAADWAMGHSLGWGLTPLQRCNCHVLQPQLMGHRTLIRMESYSFAKMQSAYFTTSSDLASKKSIHDIKYITGKSFFVDLFFLTISSL